MAAMVENDTSLTLHLKGFGLRLDYSNPIVAKAAEDVVSFVVGLKPTTLVFDGDSFAPTSFTALLPRISGAIPGLRLVAYVRESEVGRFEDAWRGVLAVELLPQADELDYTRLGAFALAATKATTVVCFGGGAVVGGEFSAALARFAADPSVPCATFHWWPVFRPSADGTQVEQCALADLPPSEYLTKH